MNLMTLQRYRNELILLATFIFMLVAFWYRLSASDNVTKNKLQIDKQISEIVAIDVYKKMWDGKTVPNRLKVLKTVVPASKVKFFNKKSKKLMAMYINLTGNELSRVTNKLINIPVQIKKFQIHQVGKNQFKLEFTCKW
jgi:hypothetical protein